MSIINLIDALNWEKEQKPKPNLRSAFDCEEASLNTFLSKHARQADEQNSSRTWVSLDKKQSTIAGYISISNTSIDKVEASPTIKSYTNPIPAMLIGRLAIDKNYKKQGLGEKLLMFGFEKAKELNTISAIQAIVVDTLNENAETFYQKYGFVKIGSTNKMIISTKNLFD
jgi:predicted GNAT family N-acyltransferase